MARSFGMCMCISVHGRVDLSTCHTQYNLIKFVWMRTTAFLFLQIRLDSKWKNLGLHKHRTHICIYTPIKLQSEITVVSRFVVM